MNALKVRNPEIPIVGSERIWHLFPENQGGNIRFNRQYRTVSIVK